MMFRTKKKKLWRGGRIIVHGHVDMMINRRFWDFITIDCFLRYNTAFKWHWHRGSSKMKPCNSGIFFDTRTDIGFFGSVLITHNYQQVLEHVLLYYVRFRVSWERERSIAPRMSSKFLSLRIRLPIDVHCLMPINPQNLKTWCGTCPLS